AARLKGAAMEEDRSRPSLPRSPSPPPPLGSRRRLRRRPKRPIAMGWDEKGGKDGKGACVAAAPAKKPAEALARAGLARDRRALARGAFHLLRRCGAHVSSQIVTRHCSMEPEMDDAQSRWQRVGEYLLGRSTLIGIASLMLLLISGYATWHGMRDFII